VTFTAFIAETNDYKYKISVWSPSLLALHISYLNPPHIHHKSLRSISLTTTDVLVKITNYHHFIHPSITYNREQENAAQRDVKE